MPHLTKEEYRQYIESSEKEELKQMTPEEAFEAGKRGDLTQYDLAGRKVSLSLLRFFERHPEIDPQKTHYLNRKSVEQDIYIDDVLDEQAKKEVDAIGPSVAMFELSLSGVKWLLEKPAVDRMKILREQFKEVIPMLKKMAKGEASDFELCPIVNTSLPEEVCRSVKRMMKCPTDSFCCKDCSLFGTGTCNAECRVVAKLIKGV